MKEIMSNPTIPANILPLASVKENERGQYYLCIYMGVISATIVRRDYQSGPFRAVALRGGGMTMNDGYGYSANSLKELIAKMFENNWRIFQFNSYEEMARFSVKFFDGEITLH